MSRKSTTRPLNHDNSMLVAAHVAHLLCGRGIGTTEDRQWDRLLDQWLTVKGISLAETLHAAEKERRVA